MKCTLTFAQTIGGNECSNQQFQVLYKVCKFKLKNNDIEFAKECTKVKNGFIVSTCAGRTCFTKADVEKVTNTYCGKPKTGNPSFSFTTSIGGHGGLPNFIKSIEESCIKNEEGVSKSPMETLSKKTTGQYKMLVLPDDQSTVPLTKMILANTCMKNAFISKGIDFIVTSGKDSGWANLQSGRMENPESIFGSCDD